MTKRGMLILMALMLALAACSSRERGVIRGEDAPPDNVPDIVGAYAVNGFDPTGTEFGGTVIIEAVSDGRYTLQWIITGALIAGEGTLDGNQLAVTWRTIDERERPQTGTGSYTVTTLGELYGERFVDGFDAPGTEALFPNE